MAEPRVFFVHLRRPGRDDERTDPIYESGSFGCTKCHSTNLMHPDHAEELRGARLAFIQGGHLGSRLVFLTPPITIKVWKYNCEARWKPWKMPFKYAEAPVLVWNHGRSDFRMVRKFARECRCPTDESGLSSKFRSRKEPLPPELAREVVEEYERLRASSPDSAIASTYDEALPRVTKADRNRERTYRCLIRELRAETNGAKTEGESRCSLYRRRKSKERKVSGIASAKGC